MFGRGKKQGGAKTGASDTRLFVGLGNPGDKYKNNRHNIGFMMIDAIADEYRFPPFRKKFQGEMSEGTIDGIKIVLLKPQTYMNNSGQSVVQAAKFFKVPPAQIYAFHDELDLPPGKIRLKTGGGNAGHNGLKSMQAHLGTGDFVRLRLGIGHPGDKERVHGHVLGDFAKSDANWLELLIEAVADHAPLLANGQESAFMSKVAAQTQQD